MEYVGVDGDKIFNLVKDRKIKEAEDFFNSINQDLERKREMYGWITFRCSPSQNEIIQKIFYEKEMAAIRKIELLYMEELEEMIVAYIDECKNEGLHLDILIDWQDDKKIQMFLRKLIYGYELPPLYINGSKVQ